MEERQKSRLPTSAGATDTARRESVRDAPDASVHVRTRGWKKNNTHIYISRSPLFGRRTRKRNVSRSGEFSGSSVCLANDVNNASEWKLAIVRMRPATFIFASSYMSSIFFDRFSSFSSLLLSFFDHLVSTLPYTGDGGGIEREAKKTLLPRLDSVIHPVII